MRIYHSVKKATNPLLIAVLLIFFSSCNSEQSNSNTDEPTIATTAITLQERSTDEDVTETNFIFKNQLCYQFADELGNKGEYEIMYQPTTGMMFVATADNIPMIDGVLIYPDATYKILGQNEMGKKVSMTYKNGKDLVVELKDEPGVSYPKDHPYTTYTLHEGNGLIFRDGVKGAQEFIKSQIYTVTYDRTSDYMTLHLTDAYPKLNARLLYGLANVPGDIGEFFKRYRELWNISSAQWPTYIGGKDYTEEMTCFGATDYHVDPALYTEQEIIR